MRPSLLHGLVPVAACAPALVFTCQSRADLITLYADGAYDVVESTELSETLEMSLGVISQTGGLGFTSVDVTLTHEFADPGPDPMFGMMSLIGAAPGDFLLGSFAGTWQASDDVPTLSSFSGTWISTETGGAYAGLMGAGTLGGVAITFDASSGSAGLLFTGDLVPAAPAAAMLAFGAFAGRRRRRA